MMRTRADIGAILLALTTAACAGTPAETAKPPEPLRIAVIGDRTGGHRPEVFEDAMDKIEAMQPDLVLSVGDLVEGYVEDEAELVRQWEEIEGQIAIFGDRFLAVPGNHDYSNEIQARLWTERRGDPYWSAVRRGVLILGLSTEDPPIALPQSAIDGHLRLLAALEKDAEAAQARVLDAYAQRGAVEKPGDVAISDEQVEFFRRVLEENPDPRWTIVLMHKPAWNYGNANFSRIEEMLADRPYTVIAGHEHYYEHQERAGRDYVVMGTTGGIWLQDGPGRVDHLLWMTVGENEPTFANIEIEGVFGLSGREATNNGN